MVVSRARTTGHGRKLHLLARKGGVRTGKSGNRLIGLLTALRRSIEVTMLTGWTSHAVSWMGALVTVELVVGCMLRLLVLLVRLGWMHQVALVAVRMR